MVAPWLQPAYLALTNLPDGSVPPFTQEITKFLRPIVATCIRLLTGHAFTGKYTAHFQPSSFDPHHCQCGKPLQTTQHPIAACLLHIKAWRQFLLPLLNTLSISTIFDTIIQRKVVRLWEISWQHHRVVSDHGSVKPHQRRRRRRIPDSYRGHMAPLKFHQRCTNSQHIDPQLYSLFTNWI